MKRILSLLLVLLVALAAAASVAEMSPQNETPPPEIEKIIILEIDGAIDSPTYESKSYRTTAKMVIAGLVEGKDFVVVRIGRPKWIDAKQIESMISAAIEASINDIII